MTSKDAVRLAREQQAEAVDFKFMDLLGTWQHFTIPMSEYEEAIFDEGLGFDGSSIRGWQPINASDMLVMPDASTAVIDPFCAVPTLSLVCNIVDPITKEEYSRDPRNIARKAEAYLKSTGIGDVAYFGPEPEFFVFNDVRFDQNQLDRITIDAPGKNKTVLARKEQNWTIASRNNTPANSDEVRRLIDTLNDQQVARFVADTATELPKYGLDQPQLRLTFSSFASENTAETGAGEHPFLNLSFGKVEGNEVYARVGEEPFVVAVNQELLAKIWTDPLQWQELAIFKFKPDEIHRVSRVTEHEESLVRTSSKDWKWIKGEGEIDKTNLESLLNTLASLRAVRWIGATTPAHGFEKPQLVITFTTSPDDKALHKLTIGNQANEGTWFAKIDGRDGTFVISGPDDSALKLPLAKTAAASPTPSPNASPSPTTVGSPGS